MHERNRRLCQTHFETTDSFPSNDCNSDLVADFLVNHVNSNPSSSLRLAEVIDSHIHCVDLNTQTVQCCRGRAGLGWRFLKAQFIEK